MNNITSIPHDLGTVSSDSHDVRKVPPNSLGSQQGHSITVDDLSQSTLAKANGKIGFPGTSSEEPSTTAVEISLEEIHQAMNETLAKLESFVPDAAHNNEETWGKIVVMHQDDTITVEADSTDWHKQVATETTESVWRDVSSPHEKAKEYFVKQLKTLYGARAVDILYPEEERGELLTVKSAQTQIAKFSKLQQIVKEDCGENLSLYGSCLKERLDELEELQKRAASFSQAALEEGVTLSPASSQAVEVTAEKTGHPLHAVNIGFALASTAVVLGITTGGASFLALLAHVAATTIAHTAHSYAAAHVTTTVAGTKTTGLIGTAVPAADMGGIHAGLSAGTVIHALESIGMDGVATIGAGTAIGAVVAGIYHANEEDITNQMIKGAIAGALIGGLATVFNPVTIGHAVSVIGGFGGAIVGTQQGAANGGGPRGAALGALSLGLAGVTLGQGIIFAGGLCQLAAHSITIPTTAASISTPLGLIESGGTIVGLGGAAMGAVLAQRRITQQSSTGIPHTTEHPELQNEGSDLDDGSK